MHGNPEAGNVAAMTTPARSKGGRPRGVETTTITVRLPVHVLDAWREAAQRRGVAVSALISTKLVEAATVGALKPPRPRPKQETRPARQPATRRELPGGPATTAR